MFVSRYREPKDFLGADDQVGFGLIGVIATDSKLCEQRLNVTPVVSVETPGERVEIIQHGLQHVHFILHALHTAEPEHMVAEETASSSDPEKG